MAETQAQQAYTEMLKSPRWQRKRLEIFQRDNWRCRHCGSGAATLHVHHMVYQSGRPPWEIGSNLLVTLCENCHTEIRRIRSSNLRQWIDEDGYIRWAPYDAGGEGEAQA